MKSLIRKSWVSDKLKIRKFFQIIVSQELLNLAEPCYVSKLKKYEDTLYDLLKVNKKELQNKIKEFYKSTSAETWLLENDTTTNLLILLLHFFSVHRDMVGFRTTMLFYNLRQYSNLFHRNFTFCQPDIFKFTLENISKSHIYAREKTVANAVYHFSNQMVNRWEKEFKSLSKPMQISKFIRECRHRHAQSIKSFTIAYYKNAEEGNRIKQQKEEISNREGEISQVETVQRVPKKVLDLVEKVTVHRFIDKKALDNSMKVNSVNKLYGQMIAKEISKPENSEILITIYKSYISNLKNISSLCSSSFIGELKKIIRGKSTHTKFFKKTCTELLEKSLKEVKIFKIYNSLSIQSKYTYLNFVIFYLCWSLKNYVC